MEKKFEASSMRVGGDGSHQFLVTAHQSKQQIATAIISKGSCASEGVTYILNVGGRAGRVLGCLKVEVEGGGSVQVTKNFSGTHRSGFVWASRALARGLTGVGHRVMSHSPPGIRSRDPSVETAHGEPCVANCVSSSGG